MSTVRLSNRAFGFTFAGIFSLIAALGGVLFGQVPHWALVTAVGFAATAALLPGLLMPLNLFWGWLAPKIASLNNAIILGLVFYLFITPIAMIMKVSGRDPMNRETRVREESYWTPVRRQTDNETLEDQF